MKIVILLSSIILLSTSITYAKSSSSAASDLFSVMDMKGTMSKTVDQQIQTKPALKSKQTAYRRLIHDILDWKNLEPQYIQLYSKYFLNTEMRQIGAFYKTPVGKKMNRLMPELSTEAMVISQ